MIRIVWCNLEKLLVFLVVIFLLVQVVVDLYLLIIILDLIDKGVINYDMVYIW